MTDQQEDDMSLKLKAWHVISIFLFVLAAWILTPMILPRISGAENGAAGQYGDMFGAVNALFSGLAFAGIIIALLFQKRELELQRRELKATREELAGSREQMKLQNATLSKQNFENTFFQMLRLHHSIVEALEFVEYSPGFTETNKHRGRKAFFFLYDDYKNSRSNKAFATQADLAEDYDKFFLRYESTLGHYFRNLYRIVSFVAESNIDDRRLYTGIVRAQLSRDELCLLCYNGLSVHGGKFKPLIEGYSLLENLELRNLANINDRLFYRREAFGDQDVPDSLSW